MAQACANLSHCCQHKTLLFVTLVNLLTKITSIENTQ